MKPRSCARAMNLKSSFYGSCTSIYNSEALKNFQNLHYGVLLRRTRRPRLIEAKSGLEPASPLLTEENESPFKIKGGQRRPHSASGPGAAMNRRDSALQLIRKLKTNWITKVLGGNISSDPEPQSTAASRPWVFSVYEPYSPSLSGLNL